MHVTQCNVWPGFVARRRRITALAHGPGLHLDSPCCCHDIRLHHHDLQLLVSYAIMKMHNKLAVGVCVLQALLTPAVAPGQCLPLDGTSGYVDIRLHHPVYLTGFTLEHIPAAIAYNVSSAPNKVSLIALSPPQTHKVKGGLFTPLKTHGPFRYDVESSSAVQTFSIFAETPEPVSFVRLQVR